MAVFDPDRVAMHMLDLWRQVGAWGQIASKDDEPIAAFFAWWRTPVCWQVSLIATDRWREIVRPMSLYMRYDVFPNNFRAHKLRRVECRAMAEHHDARRWLTWLGAHEECRVPGWGKDGEEFIQYAWSADDVFGRRKAEASGTDRNDHAAADH